MQPPNTTTEGLLQLVFADHFPIDNASVLAFRISIHQRTVLYMLISVSAFALMNSMVKYLNAYPAFQLVFFRAVGTFCLSLAYLLRNDISIWGKEKGLLISRAIFGTLSLSLFFIAIKLMPLGSAVTLRYLSPVFGIILAVLFLKEKVRNIQWLYLMMAVIGAGIIKGFDPRIDTLGLIVIVLSALFSGMVYVLIRKIGRREHPLVIVNYFMFTAMIVGLIGAIPVWKQPIGIDWLLLFGLGILGFVGQLFMTMGLQIGLTSKAAPIKYAEVIFVLLISLFWFGEKQGWLALLGIALIVGGVTLNSFTKAKL